MDSFCAQAHASQGAKTESELKPKVWPEMKSAILHKIAMADWMEAFSNRVTRHAA